MKADRRNCAADRDDAWTLMASLFLLTVVMCVVSAISAIVQVMRIDPARVFTR